MVGTRVVGSAVGLAVLTPGGLVGFVVEGLRERGIPVGRVEAKQGKEENVSNE